ncbi:MULTISPECIES: hypothetical protein [unclassified Sinorhizobium]|uniref:hypothetical protein n=1 Tax=unclassified Sinorhizobium TaxID=2613772 RepID=UPI00352594D4
MSITDTTPRFARPKTRALHALDMSRLEGYQWNAVYDALTLATTGILGVQNQPRCQGAGGASLNSAGEYLDILVEFLNLERTRLIECLKLHEPDTEDHRLIRANLLMRFEAEYGELSMPELAAYALSLATEKKA